MDYECEFCPEIIQAVNRFNERNHNRIKIVDVDGLEFKKYEDIALEIQERHSKKEFSTPMMLFGRDDGTVQITGVFDKVGVLEFLKTLNNEEDYYENH